MARSNKHYDTKREELIQIALDLFVEKGYENTTITQIMKASKLSKGGMYHYFSSKEEVLNAVIEYGLTQELEKTKAGMKNLPIEKKLIYFLSDGGSIGEFTLKLLSYKDSNAESLAAYRIREYNIHLCTPILADIIEEGVAAGIYKTKYPKAMGEFFILLIKAVIETNILPPVNAEDKRQRLEALIHIAKFCLELDDKQTEELRQFSYDNIPLISAKEGTTT